MVLDSAGSGGDSGDPPTTAATDTIKSVTPSAPSVELYHPLKIEVVTSQSFKNGFDPDEITVDAVFTSSCGLPITEPCFYESSSNGQANWQCRFAPRKQADYAYSIVLKDSAGIARSESLALKTEATTSDGFLHSDTANAVAPNSASLYDFRFDSGKAWRGVGEDVAWEIGQYKFSSVIPRLHANNLNMFRIWHKSNGLPIEWSALTMYNQAASTYFDQLVTLAEQNGVYMMVMMNDYRDVRQLGEQPVQRQQRRPVRVARRLLHESEGDCDLQKEATLLRRALGLQPGNPVVRILQRDRQRIGLDQHQRGRRCHVD